MLSVFARRTNTPRRRSRGQSLAEFALVAPILLLILLFAIDFGRALYGWVILQNSTRIAANFAALNPDGWQGSGNVAIQAEYETLLDNDLGTANCQAPSTPPAPVFTDGPDTAVAGGNPDSAFDFGDTVVVGLSCTFQPVTPIIGSVVGTNLQLSASAEFRIRAGELTGLPNPTRIPPPPTPTPTPGPTATPTATPVVCRTVPDLVRNGVNSQTVAEARAEWAAAGFTGSITPATGQNQKTVVSQTVPAGSCVSPSTSITVTHT